MDSSGFEKSNPLIRTPDQRLRVFISSTLNELAEERGVVRQAVLRLRLTPVMFEAGARPHPARDLYQAYLSQSHVFVGIYWQKYGWVGPGMEISGLEEEYRLSQGMPRLIYVKRPAPEREEGLARMLVHLQQEGTASYRYFSSTTELAELVENDLALLLTESFESARVAAPLQISPRPLTNIPIPRNPMLGRETELATICNWFLQENVGLVTLTGAGGTGKSRLGLEVALTLRDQFKDGVFLVRLTPVSDVERVVPTITETLGLRESAQGIPLDEILMRHLQDRQILLLLDNFEQVIEAAPKIADLMEKCPHIKVLATSRAPLHIRGERELQIRPLATPDLKTDMDWQKLSQYASVALFIQRAQSLRPDFSVTNETAPYVAEICFRLDGLPLAIELAAARIKLLSPKDLLTRLENRFDILSGGLRDLPERHRTLRGAIDWSYNLLSESARALFRRLAIFNGGWNLEAAEAVCDNEGDLGSTVIEELEALVDSSLLTQSEGVDGQPRFGMLETIREYALEKLANSGEAEAIRRAHADFFLRFVEEVEPRIRSAERIRWRRVLEQDLENIRAVIRWSNSKSDPEYFGYRIQIALSYFWTLCGYISEGRQYARQASQVADDVATPLAIRAGLKLLDGGIAYIQGETEYAEPILLEAVELARQADDKQLLAIAAFNCGACEMSLLKISQAQALWQESDELFSQLDNEWEKVVALFWRSNLAVIQGNEEQAREIIARCLELARLQGDPWLSVLPFISLLQRTFQQDDLENARELLLQAESVLRIVGDMWSLAWVLNELAQTTMKLGDFESARGHIRESLELGREHGNMVAVAFSLTEIAFLAGLKLDAETDAGRRLEIMRKMARLCGAVKPILDRSSQFKGSGLGEVCLQLLMQVQSRIDLNVWESVSKEGGSAPLDQTLTLAAQELRGE